MAMESEMNRQKGFFCELINEKLQYGPSRAVNCFVVVVVVVVVIVVVILQSTHCFLLFSVQVALLASSQSQVQGN